MTKIFIFILTVYMFIFVSIPATAECITGFACSIETLEETQIKQNIKMAENINKYFDKSVNEQIFFNKKPVQISYNDLFVFNTIV